MQDDSEHRGDSGSPLRDSGTDLGPPTLEMAQAVMGNRTKSLIVRHLWQEGPSVGGDILAGTQVSGGTLSQAMKQLEDWRIVEASLPPEKRHGRPVRYTLDRDRVRTLIAVWTDFIEGGLD